MMTSLPLLAYFKKFISVCKRGKRSKYLGKKLSKGTITQYQCVYKLLEEFEKKRGASLTIRLLKNRSLTTFGKEKKYWQEFFKCFLFFLYKDKSCFDTYVGSVLKILKTFFNYLHEEKGLPVGNFYKTFKVNTEPFTPVILSPSQLEFLINNNKFEESLPIHLKTVKDIFVFGCTVALRYCDLMRLKKEHLVEGPGGKYLLIHTRKTGTLVRLPLPQHLLAIIDKYKRKPGGYLLPRLSSTNLNIQVKALARKAGWNQPFPKIRFKQGKPVEIRNPKGSCLSFGDQVTTHTMRRTAITTLLVLGVPEHIVRRISGHSPNSKEFYRYVVIAQEYLDRHLIHAYNKLLHTKKNSSGPPED